MLGINIRLLLAVLKTATLAVATRAITGPVGTGLGSPVGWSFDSLQLSLTMRKLTLVAIRAHVCLHKRHAELSLVQLGIKRLVGSFGCLGVARAARVGGMSRRGCGRDGVISGLVGVRKFLGGEVHVLTVVKCVELIVLRLGGLVEVQVFLGQGHEKTVRKKGLCVL